LNPLTVDYMPLDAIAPADLNPKRHHVDLGSSIDRFGFADAPILDERTGKLVAGHGRCEALAARRDRGEDPPEGVRLDPDGLWLVPVQRGWSSRSDAEAAAFLVAHNRIGEAGGWDDAELAKLLEGLGEAQVETSGLGFSDKELAALMPPVEQPEPPAAIEAPKEPVSKRGEVYALGPHRLMCGDSTSAEDVAALLAGDVPNLMVTDPPYGVEYDADWRNEAAAKGLIAHAARRVGKVENDNRADWSEAWALFPGAVAYVWHADCKSPEVACSLAGFDLRGLICWAKPRFVISRGHYHHQHEPCWYAVRKGATASWAGDRSQTTLWSIGLDANLEGDVKHSTQKPIECMERPIRNHEGDVYDPFLGSGTTLIAAARTGRRCYGMELSPAYCDVIRKRWGDYARANDVDPGPDAL